MNKVQNGVWSGIIATSTMTLTFLQLFKYLSREQKSALPPATIVDDTMKAVKLDVDLSLASRQNMTLAVHYGYGIVGGIIYSFLTKNKKSSVSDGIFFGLGVWAVSYLGLIPALGFRASGYQMSASRNSLMIAAHVVWGSTLAYSENLFKSYGNPMLDAHREVR